MVMMTIDYHLKPRSEGLACVKGVGAILNKCARSCARPRNELEALAALRSVSDQGSRRRTRESTPRHRRSNVRIWSASNWSAVARMSAPGSVICRVARS